VLFVITADIQAAGLARIMPQGVKPGDARVGFLKPSDGALDFPGIFEPPFGDAFAKCGGAF